MTDDQRHELDIVWEKRKILWIQGSAKIVAGNKLWEEVKALPGAARISVWYAFSEMSAEAATKVWAGYNDRVEGDRVWHDAIVQHVGPQTKVSWTYDDAAKGYDCALETGEVFKA